MASAAAGEFVASGNASSKPRPSSANGENEVAAWAAWASAGGDPSGTRGGDSSKSHVGPAESTSLRGGDGPPSATWRRRRQASSGPCEAAGRTTAHVRRGSRALRTRRALCACHHRVQRASERRGKRWGNQHGIQRPSIARGDKRRSKKRVVKRRNGLKRRDGHSRRRQGGTKSGEAV